MKVALVGIVRNERKDILHWLGWHAKLGIDSFIIFDDNSDDGTDLLLKAASLSLDIRFFRIEKASNSFSERKRIVYLDAIAGLKKSAEWVLFLDTDEYLNLYRHNHVHNFLAEFDEKVGAIAVNRCTYGANREILRPEHPNPYAFTHHSAPNHRYNRWIKSFIRPSYFNGVWENNHYFPLVKGRYVSPEGKDVQWVQPGETSTPAEWKTARIMYYPGGSLEQLVERERRGHASTIRLEDLYSELMTKIHDSRPQGQVKAIKEWMRPIIMQGVALTLTKIQRLFPLQHEETLTTENQNLWKTNFKIARVIPWNQQRLEIHGGLVCAQERPQNRSTLFILYDKTKIPGTALLFALNNTNNPLDFSIHADSRLLGFLPYDLLPAQTDGRVFLRKKGGLSQKRNFLTTVPNEPLVSDRPNTALWETFELQECPTALDSKPWEEFPFIRLIKAFLSSTRNIKVILYLAKLDRALSVRLLPFFLDYLPLDEKLFLEAQLMAVQPFLF
ncbi:glycosyltransferase family 2 protein [Aristophania vespae]|uniref:glycosyltransferase family 2 protein n=1 Tax=Aristophania vespae TaxID=2697033 RepID=UPI0023515D6F|nr:glycosyltransferase family 2 protein [Aristophania vespae]UMM64280.1 hypothetical protein DM15PD_12900 [Aristophania vespae]